MKLFVGAKGVVVFKDKVLLVRESANYTDGTGAGRWDMVGGRINEKEMVRDGLVREVFEESGLKVIPGELLEVFDGFPVIKGEKIHVVRLYFLCATDTDKVVLSQDHDMYEWVDPMAPGDKVLMDDIKEVLDKIVTMV